MINSDVIERATTRAMETQIQYDDQGMDAQEALREAFGVDPDALGNWSTQAATTQISKMGELIHAFTISETGTEDEDEAFGEALRFMSAIISTTFCAGVAAGREDARVTLPDLG